MTKRVDAWGRDYDRLNWYLNRRGWEYIDSKGYYEYKTELDFDAMLDEQKAEGYPSIDERVRLAHIEYDSIFAEEAALRPRAMPTDFPRRIPSNTVRLALIRKLFNPNQAWRFGN